MNVLRNALLTLTLMFNITASGLAQSDKMADGLSSKDGYPAATLSNGRIDLVVYLPDAERGYYRGVRFDWSSQVGSVRYNQHDWFGDSSISSLKPGIGTGTTAECGMGYNGLPSALGYDDAKPNESFLKIGVGELRKPTMPEVKGAASNQYALWYPYELIQTFPWSVQRGKDWIEFVQESGAVRGYQYRLTRRIALSDGNGFTIDATLENLGSKPINQTSYEHNFVRIGDALVGLGWGVGYSFSPQFHEEEGRAAFLKTEGTTIRLARDLSKDDASAGYDLEGFSKTSTNNRMLVSAGLPDRLLISSDEPLVQSRLYITPQTMCPEAHIAVVVPPGKSKHWQTRYEFVH